MSKPIQKCIDKYAKAQVKTADPDQKVIFKRFRRFLLVTSYLFFFISFVLLLDSFVAPSLLCFKEYTSYKQVQSEKVAWNIEPETKKHSSLFELKTVLLYMADKAKNTHTDKLIEIADKIMISLTIAVIGIILSETRKKIAVPDFDTFIEQLEKIDSPVLTMVIISLSVHFVSEIIGKRNLLSYPNAFGSGFLIISIAFYCYIAHYRGRNTDIHKQKPTDKDKAK